MNLEEENLKLKEELEKIKQELKDYKDRYYLVVEAANDGIWDWNIQTNTLYNSPRWKETLGFKDDELKSEFDTWSKLVHPDDKNSVLEKIQKHLKGDTTVYQAEYRLKHKNGEYIWILDRGKVMFDINNQPLKMSGTLTDITERKKYEEQLKENELRIRAIMNCMSEGVLVLDKEGKFIYTNPSFSRVLGLTVEQIEGKTPLDPKWRVIHEDGSPYPGDTHPSWQTLKTGQAIHNDIQGIVLSETEINWILANSEPLIKPEANELYGVVVTFTDITKQKKMMEELQELNTNLEEKIKKSVNEIREKDKMLLHQSRLAMMGEMIGNIAHQWRQPLNAIGVIIQDMQDAFEFKELDADYMSNSVRLAIEQLDFMSSTIDDFRNFFKPNKKKLFFNPKEQVEKAISLLEANFRTYKISLHISLIDDITIEGYPNEYAQVILNILNNAKDVLIERNINNKNLSISLSFDNNKSLLSIQDNAGGIPQDIIDKIFDPYFTTKHQTQGTGLGLFMSKMIIEQNMNGKLFAINKDDGAIFYMIV